jgi:acetoacetate decarboxylase
MSFKKTMKEIKEGQKETFDFYDAEMLSIIYETKPEIVKNLLPPPLKPTDKPLAILFTARYPKTNFGLSYDESALFLLCRFRRRIGVYCLSMPISNGIAMAGGREQFGYPKKMAKIHFERKSNKVHCWTERYGTKFVEITAEIEQEATKEDVTKSIWGDYKTTWNVYNYKHFPHPGRVGFDYWPRLVEEPVTFNRKKIEICNAKLTLRPLRTDPWSEIEVVKILETVYTYGDNYMHKGKYVAIVNPLRFAPYSFLKWD